MELHERDVFRRTDYRRAAYEDESSRERVQRRRSDEEEEEDDDAEEERVADSRLFGGRGERKKVRKNVRERRVSREDQVQ